MNYSFLQTEPQVIKSDSYIGKNGLGTQIKVERHAVSTVGVAILGSENKHMIPQRFSIPFPRERVRELYAKGRVFLELKSDIQDLEEKPSLLLIDESEAEPKMQRPIHVLRVKYMLPVRMVSISVLDEGGKQVFQSEGTEQTTNAVDSR